MFVRAGCEGFIKFFNQIFLRSDFSFKITT